AACEAGRALVRAADGMQPAGGGVAAGERDVDGLGGQPRVESGGVERDLAVGQRGADGVAGAVDRLARRLALVAGQRAQRLELRGDAAALAEQRDAQGFQRLGCVGRGDVDQRPPRQLFNPTHRTASSDILPSGVIEPSGHRITLSPAYFVTGLPCHRITLSPNHPVIPSAARDLLVGARSRSLAALGMTPGEAASSRACPQNETWGRTCALPHACTALYVRTARPHR